MKELAIDVYLYKDNTFRVYSKLSRTPIYLYDSVLKLDLNYIPWPRRNGNLLW